MKKIISFIFLLVLLLIVGCSRQNNNNNNNNNENEDNKQPQACEHTSSEWQVINDSTCTKLGSKQLICTQCKDVLTTASITYKEHTIEIIAKVDATCTKDGLTEGSYCKSCSQVLVKQEVINKLEHHYILNNELSDSEVLVYVCEKCNDSYQEVNSGSNPCQNGHSESDWIVIDTPTCSKLGLSKKECSVCGIITETKELQKLDHTEIILEKVEPTCTNTGLTVGVKCSICNEIIVEQEIISKIEHNYYVSATIEPTPTVNGKATYKCTMCNDTYDVVLPSTGYYDSSKATVINLTDNKISISNDNGGVTIDNNTIVIHLGGEYDLVGTLSNGNVIVRLNEEDKAIINLRGVNISCDYDNPIFIESGDKVEISAKIDTKNYINDERTITTADSVGAAIYSKVDLEIKGKGKLYIESTYNNGIGSTKDLEIKNLTLDVNVPNNALKGNDSLTIESGTIKAVSSSGDALKTENTDVSDKGNQRGIITINGGTLDLYAAFDGIDAAYNVVINGGTINIYTDKYSGYTGDVVVPTKEILYLRISSKTNLTRYNYKYSVKLIYSDGTVSWQQGTQETSQQTRYYKFELPENVSQIKFFVYSNAQTPNQETNYVYCTDQMAINTSYDTYYVNSVNSSSKLLAGSWTNYSSGGATGPGGGGPGGMGPGGGMDGNTEKETYSCKGIKADNEIVINDGIINIESRDDALHTNSDVLLASGSYGTANITINGGNITLYSDDDAIHADQTLKIYGGSIIITNSYEGIEGNYIYFEGGTVQINSRDDGINAKNTLYFNGSTVYLNANGDGIDSNIAVIMNAGIVLAQGPSNGGNGVIDFDRSFTFNGGLLLAVGCSGMNQKPTASSGNTSTSKSISTTTSSYVNVVSNGTIIATIKITKSSQNYCVLAYNNTVYPSCSVTVTTSNSNTLVNNLYYIG